MDKQMIEEMAKVIMQPQDCKGYEDNRGCYFGNGKGCKKCKIERHENAQIMADYLYNAGYRKIPENAVVLTEERNKIICDRLEQLERVQVELQELNAKYYNEAKDLRRELKQARKETAEKFAERVKMAFYYHFDELIPSIMADKIDEICKEFTEEKV